MKVLRQDGTNLQRNGGREMLNIYKNTVLIFFSLLLLLFSSGSMAYASGVNFKISFDRSINIVPLEGQSKICDTGDSVTLNAKGRLWLTGNETIEGFTEIVCQNLSTEPVTVELINEETPWLNVTEPAQCGEWQKNLLICPVGNMEKGFFCKITERTAAGAAGGSKKQKSASVNVRALTVQESREKEMDDQQYLQKRIEYYAAGIDLCGLMHEKTGKIFINWIIYSGGTVDKVTIDSQTASEDNETARCIAEQIPLWKFPEWEKNSQVSYQF